MTLGAVGGSILAYNSTDSKVLKNWMVSPQAKEYVLVDRIERGLHLVILMSKENTALHNNFDWKWSEHYLSILEKDDGYLMLFEVKEYQKHVTPGESFVHWRFTDIDMDGSFDIVEREYYITINDAFVFPFYPEGFVNPEWENIDSEQAETKYQNEVKYWHSLVRLPM